MTRTSKWVFPLLAVAGLCLLAGVAAGAPVSVSVSVFHEQLAPHGRWVSEPSYGDVWIPSGVASGWEPYVDGEWEYTDYGWTWVSDDAWGDVPYHYGTWTSVDRYGWVWVPGTVWAPAWVTWAYTDDYVGWAPVPPSFALSSRGYYGAPIVVPATRYIFVPAPRFVGVRVSTVRIPQAQAVTIFTRASKTTRFQVSNGIVRVQGPPAARIERAMGHKLERVPAQRLRVQPTTLAAAGVTGSQSIRVVAPAAQVRAHGNEKAAANAKRPDAARQGASHSPAEARDAKPAASDRSHSGQKTRANQPVTRADTGKPAPKRAESHARPAPSKPDRNPAATGERPKNSGADAHPPAEHRVRAAPAREPGSHPPATDAHPPAERRPPPPPPARNSAEPKPKDKDKEPPRTR
jgi:hypothetical protein